MDTKVITCRTHGGTFWVPVKRGRPPLNCTPENKCRKTPQGAAVRRAVVTSDATHRVVDAPEPVEAAMARARRDSTPVKPAEVAPTARSKTSRGVLSGKAAKAQLEALGWQAEGKAAEGIVSVTATRGIELLVIMWEMDGELISQSYSLWDTSVGTARNGKPDSKLPFDPDEIPDAELVGYLQGMKVTWWNSLAQANETAVISPDKITIEHSYTGQGDEVPGDRTVKFADHDSKRFRAFRLAALIKVG